MNKSLRQSLIVKTGIATAVVLIVAGGLLYAIIAGALRVQVDNGLRAKALFLASTVEQIPGSIEVDGEDLQISDFEFEASPDYLLIFEGDGSLLYKSESLANLDPPFPVAPPDTPQFQPLTLPNGEAGRQVVLNFQPQIEEDWIDAEIDLVQVTLVLAESVVPVNRMLDRFRLLLIALFTVVLIVLAVVIRWSVAAGLRPVDQTVHRIETLDANDLSARLATANTPAELLPLILRLNELIARLEQVFERERSFSADVAHELRTPLAGLQSILEVNLMKPRSAEEHQKTVSDSLEIAQALSLLITNLLALARFEAGQIELAPEALDIAEFLARVWRPISESVSARELTVEFDSPPDCTLTTDATLLEMIVRNLLDNAVSYVDQAGTIHCTVVCEADEFQLTISNSGCRITQDEAEALCERFSRADQARSATGRHCGLGLPLLANAVKALKGTFAIAAEPDGLYQVTVKLPLLPGRG